MTLQEAGPPGEEETLRTTAPASRDGSQPFLTVSSCGLCKAAPSMTSRRLPTAHHHIPISQKTTIMMTIMIMAISGAPVHARHQAKSWLMSSHSVVSHTP